MLIFFNLIILISNGNNRNYKKRNLEDENFRDLSIYPDLFNFNDHFPYEIGTKDIFINAMNEAKDKLEDIFLIYPETNPAAGLDIDESLYDFKNYMGISSWDDSIFIDETTLSVETNNIFIIFKFDNLNNVDMTSKIAITYANRMPIIGLVTIHDNIPQSKLNKNYLTLLFLQQFINILGFQIKFTPLGPSTFDGCIEAETDALVGDDISGIEVLKVNKAFTNKTKLINYAREYFACDEINEIKLEIGEYNKVYWPSRLFSADIMTKFNNYQEKFISGFTLALLEDTGYLRVKENYAYTGRLMIPGKNQGCDCYFNGNCKIESDDDDDDKLSTGAIIGIVFGCVGFILIVFGIICFILKKGKKDYQITQLNNEEKIVEEKLGGDGVCGNNNNQQHEAKIQIEDVDKQNQVEIHSNAKRKISNK